PAPPVPSPLSLHDALPIYLVRDPLRHFLPGGGLLRLDEGRQVLEDHHGPEAPPLVVPEPRPVQSQDQHAAPHLGLSLPRQALPRSEEHTSELQSRSDLVCR